MENRFNVTKADVFRDSNYRPGTRMWTLENAEYGANVLCDMVIKELQTPFDYALVTNKIVDYIFTIDYRKQIDQNSVFMKNCFT